MADPFLLGGAGTLGLAAPLQAQELHLHMHGCHAG
jgi:hypothetical protein